MNNRLTKQRKLILETVQAICFHPTAEEIYLRVKKQIQHISMGTVYRNLDYLVARNLIKRLDIPGQPARFDGDMEPHGYFVCNEKKRIYDVPIEIDQLKSLFQTSDVIQDINNIHIVIYGKSKNTVLERQMRKGQLK